MGRLRDEPLKADEEYRVMSNTNTVHFPLFFVIGFF